MAEPVSKAPCGQCRHYRMNRYLESICSKTGKNVGYLWNKECYEPIPQPSTIGIEESTQNANNMTQNANNMAQNANNMAQNANNMAQNANNMAQNANNMAQNANTKVCKDCGRELPIESFQRQVKSKDGYMHICKECKRKKVVDGFREKPLEATAKGDAVKPFSMIGSATDKELVDELRARGWDVKCTKTIEL